MLTKIFLTCPGHFYMSGIINDVTPTIGFMRAILSQVLRVAFYLREFKLPMVLWPSFKINTLEAKPFWQHWRLPSFAKK